MTELVKIISCYGPLAVANNALCADKTIEVYRKKNRKYVVKIFNGPCTKPYIRQTFSNSTEMELYVEGHSKPYPKVVKEEF